MNKRKIWPSQDQEAKVEKFYETGTEGFHDFHGGYLNFGLWTRPGMSYLQAAENLVQTLGEKLGLNGQSVLLDVGCGMGAQDIFLFKHFEPRSINGLDVTWKHVERARERAQRGGLSETQLRFYHGTAVKLPFSDNTFTHVLAIESAEHVNTREDFFREAYRVLQPDGVMVCADYSLARQPRTLFERGIIESARRLWQVPKANVYGSDVFEEKLKRSGFKNIQIANVGAYTIPGYYFDHRKPETVREVRKVRGFFKGVIGGYLIDRGVYSAYQQGLCEYIIVRSEKPRFKF